MAYVKAKTALNEIAAQITAVETRFASAKSTMEGGAAALAAIPTKYALELAEIDAYTGADAAETVSKAEKAKLTTDFLALQSRINALIATPEFTA